MREVYERHYETIYQYVFYLTTDSSRTDDFVQETFLRFYRMQQVTNEKAVLIRIARNLVYDYFRRKRLIQWLPLIKDDREDVRPLPEEILEKSQQVQNMYQALAHIKIQYREVIVLRYMEELSVKEVAELLKLSEAQVKNHTARGLKALRWRLGSDFDV